jgi:threonine dehydratase
MRAYYTDTHNLAEGAGAAPLAAAAKHSQPGQRVAVILCGGNVDASVFGEVIRSA